MRSTLPPKYLLHARQKSGHAHDLISAFQKSVESYTKSNKIRLTFLPWSDPSSCRVVIKIKKNIPEKFSLLAGDAIHNLRATLDILVTGSTKLNGGDTRDIHFPTGKNQPEFDKSVDKLRVRGADENVLNLIRTFRPYGENNPIRALHELDIREKHYELLSLSLDSIFSFPDLAMTVDFGPSPQGKSQSFTMQLPPGRNLGENSEGVPVIKFAQNLPLHEGSAVSNLFMLWDIVDKMVEAFENLRYHPIAS